MYLPIDCTTIPFNTDDAVVQSEAISEDTRQRMHIAMGPHSASTFFFQLGTASNESRSVEEKTITQAPAPAPKTVPSCVTVLL
eukprot:9480532-Pyramimonas_sp.AAC.1